MKPLRELWGWPLRILGPQGAIVVLLMAIAVLALWAAPGVTAPIEATATLALTLFAAAQLRREWVENHRRRSAADARASATAFLLRQLILKWLAGSEDLHNIRGWLIEWSPEEVEEASQLAVDLSGLAADCSEPVNEAITHAFVGLQLARERILRVQWLLRDVSRERAYLLLTRPGDEEILGLPPLIQQDLDECDRYLREGVIDPRLLAADGRWRTGVRRAGQPWAAGQDR